MDDNQGLKALEQNPLLWHSVDDIPEEMLAGLKSDDMYTRYNSPDDVFTPFNS